ncbi:hypothetical protein HF324_23535 [Chitinophaga oryzae]|uniref:Uncharacterized protein n=1 Tax=Chitinophaga oryzae TaxID=2725414 RepID=A0AAE6ZK05_9BACT|nr:hypothetical protein [Chitinophaga oryzae]QJB34124.1 hypothetical protein HF329_23685 [Chitinophaga oryzae]QJB40644.1 hypothetical protein HF324_23535 [Chitinophaga oryzae]
MARYRPPLLSGRNICQTAANGIQLQPRHPGHFPAILQTIQDQHFAVILS